MRLRTLLAAAFAALAPLSANALSCMPPSVERSFTAWAEAPEHYYIAVGRLTPAAPVPAIPGMTNDHPPEGYRTVYRLDGELLTPDPGHAIRTTIWVRASCAGPWCGGFPVSGERALFAMKALPDNTLELTMAPCGGNLFAQNVDAAASTVRACLANGGRCDAGGSDLPGDEARAVVYVAPYREDCGGPGRRRCLVVDGAVIQERIAGYKHQDGYGATIEVARQRIGPPHAPRWRYRLIREIERHAM